MRRREFIGIVGGAAASWPLAVRAQQPDRMRRVALLVLYAENDPQGQARAAAFRQGLESAGWTIGRTRLCLGYIQPGLDELGHGRIASVGA